MTRRTTHKRNRRLSVALLTAATIAALLPAAAATASVAEAAPAPQAAGGSACTTASPPSTASSQYLLPAWSDSSGWKDPAQYETILNGDVNGDGIGDLVARSAATIETFTWDRNYNNPDKAYDPLPGQWTQIMPKGTPPSMPLEDGWWDPSRYSTFRLADLDGTKVNGNTVDELIVRTPSGLWIYKWDLAGGTNTWLAPIKTTAFSDAAGFGQSHPDTYTTIQTGDVDNDGKAEIVGRGPNGVQSWKLNAAGTDLTRLDLDGVFTDTGSWNEEQYYATIRLGDVDGDHEAELIGRGYDGLQVWKLNGNTWEPVSTLTAWADAPWSTPEYYKTIRVGDLDGNGTDDIVGRTPNGMDTRSLQPDKTWAQLAPLGGFTDVSGFAKPDAYETIQVADVLSSSKQKKLIGRTWDGVYTIAIQNGTWVQLAGPVGQFSDANGWSTFTSPVANDRPTPSDFRYSTVRPATVIKGQPQLIIGRDATGIRTVDATGTSPSSPYPKYTNLQGIPNGLNTPPAQLPDTEEGRAYWYINARAARSYWPLAGDSQTILAQYRNPTEQTNLAALNGILGQRGFDPGQDTALNVSRPTYDKVNQDVNDWTTSVLTLYGELLGSQGMKDLVEQSFVVNAGDVDTIKAKFESNPALVALLGDLLWGFIGLLGAAGILIPGIGAAEVAAIAGFAGLVGSGVAGGVGFWNPNAAVDTEGDKLKEQLVNAFCGASTFIDQSYDQMVQDYGLLTSQVRMIEQAPATAQNFDAKRAGIVKAQQLWIWQQFGNMRSGHNFWVGWCDFGGSSGCEWDNHDSYTWNSPENGNISYRLIDEWDGGGRGYCPDSILSYSYPDLATLDPSAAAMFAPRVTDDATLAGIPRDDRAGIQGWDLGTHRCDNG